MKPEAQRMAIAEAVFDACVAKDSMGRLLPPVSCSAGRCDWLYNQQSCSAGRCDWLYNQHGYQCAEPATWCCPTLDEKWQFKWCRNCDTHKPMTDALLAKHEISPAYWKRIDQQNAPGEPPARENQKR